MMSSVSSSTNSLQDSQDNRKDVDNITEHAVAAPVKKGPKVSESDMLFYYKHLLPFKYIFHWISHSNTEITNSFTNREFAYEYRSGAYQRYNSYTSLTDFKNSVIKANPTRFEIGAVYTVNPKERKTLPKSAMKPLEKDFVFDIDLTDYDGIRTCCSGTDICEKCWKFITVGSQVIEKALVEDFGFKNFIWVFSGRRGAHCWISDNKARNLNESKRRAIVEYMDVLGSPNGSGGGRQNGNRNGLNIKRPLHPHVKRSLEILKKKFKNIILDEQNPWEDDKVAFEGLLPMISDKNLRALLKDHWTNSPGRSSFEKWKDIKTIYENNSSKIIKNFGIQNFQNMREDIIIETLYPRLDIEVSRQLIHLLKSPFCIHPGTGNVCVPFDSKIMFEDYENELVAEESGNYEDYKKKGFDPMNAPNLSLLQTEFENATINGDFDANDDDWNRTSLKPYVKLFTDFVSKLVEDEEKVAQRQAKKRKLTG
ncbi:DNA primase subunit [Saccharomycopsis crataegensis]|uniref:DNA primase n=1 Tax=Saccharomycopsis crataegensis TaxID=43959 RepID=A0AAV5QMB8_9ASCO|nr:DNA primase subunit [Saccharomycopsis crataegensis]